MILLEIHLKNNKNIYVNINSEWLSEHEELSLLVNYYYYYYWLSWQ